MSRGGEVGFPVFFGSALAFVAPAEAEEPTLELTPINGEETAWAMVGVEGHLDHNGTAGYQGVSPLIGFVYDYHGARLTGVGGVELQRTNPFTRPNVGMQARLALDHRVVDAELRTTMGFETQRVGNPRGVPAEGPGREAMTFPIYGGLDVSFALPVGKTPLGLGGRVSSDLTWNWDVEFGSGYGEAQVDAGVAVDLTAGEVSFRPSFGGGVISDGLTGVTEGYVATGMGLEARHGATRFHLDPMVHLGPFAGGSLSATLETTPIMVRTDLGLRESPWFGAGDEVASRPEYSVRIEILGKLPTVPDKK